MLLILLVTLMIPSLARAQTEWTHCAGEDVRCEFSGTKEVRYGVEPAYVYQVHTDGVMCSNDVFGDPLVGALKSCSYRDQQTGSAPPPDGECHWPSGACLVPGTSSTWTNGKVTWAGNPFCATGGLVDSTSPAIDAGMKIEGHHCPGPGAASQYPRIMSAGWLDSPCVEWYGAEVDIGACEFVPPGHSVPPAPTGLLVE
jgi:hypothetical protein